MKKKSIKMFRDQINSRIKIMIIMAIQRKNKMIKMQIIMIKMKIKK